MKKSDRIIVYIVGFVFGSLLVSVIMMRRTAREESAVDPWMLHNAAIVESGAMVLPDSVPESIKVGKILDFGYLPSEAAAVERVWHMNYDSSYPYVRVVENVETGECSFMAADQILINLSADIDVTELKPMLDTLGLNIRMFNRKDRIAVVGVLNTDLDAVPATIAALQPYSELFEAAGPDVIRFQD